MASMTGGPLAGLRVIEFAGLGPAPFCGMLLSDMGADVIRVDRPGAAATSPFAVTERGRRSVILDLKTSAGNDAALRLIARADILIEGFRPGVMERLGLAPDHALARNPRLVYGRMTGWGQSGPYAGMAGHDVNYVALTGALHMIGPRDRPMMPLNLVGDYGGGGMFLALGVLAALQHAQKTGEGQVVDAAMVDGVASLMSANYGALASGVLTDEREANVGNGACHYMGPFACSDGRFISLAAWEPQFCGLGLRTGRDRRLFQP
jgi:alpha-methylacyl-CoA racemase